MASGPHGPGAGAPRAAGADPVVTRTPHCAFSSLPRTACSSGDPLSPHSPRRPCPGRGCLATHLRAWSRCRPEGFCRRNCRTPAPSQWPDPSGQLTVLPPSCVSSSHCSGVGVTEVPGRGWGEVPEAPIDQEPSLGPERWHITPASSATMRPMRWGRAVPRPGRQREGRTPGPQPRGHVFPSAPTFHLHFSSLPFPSPQSCSGWQTNFYSVIVVST